MRILLIFIFTVVLISSCDSRTPQEPTLDEKIGQMIMVGFRGLDVDENNSIYDDIKTHHIGGVILFDYDLPSKSPIRNIRSAEQVEKLNAQLQAFADTPLFIAVDQEGGRVARLKPKHGFPETLSAEMINRLNDTDPDSVENYLGRQAALLDSLGFNLNFAPVVDLDLNPDNPVIGGLQRSYSSDPDTVIKLAGKVINALRSEHVIPVIKHFPGHGSAADDSHHGIADVTHTWSKLELRPYRILIREKQVPAVMTAHIFHAGLDSTYPATLSEPVIRGLLRDSLKFGGVVFSDDMQMKAIRSYFGLRESIRRAIEAGVDVLIFANNSVYDEQIAEKAITHIREMVERGAISRQRIDRSYNRIMELKNSYLSADQNPSD